MAGERTFKIVFKGDPKDANQAFDSVEKKADKLGSTLGGVTKIAAGVALGLVATKLPGFLMDSAKAAAEDEAATQRLNKTLENHIKLAGLDADALGELQGDVNERIASAQKLAFTDDEARDSLQFLLNATDDYGEATKRSGLAMDLARGANIPLAQATKLLGKINEENVNTFKKLGIELPKNATEADALAAVQKRFAGQADAYAKSTAGQFAQAQIAMSEIKESIGAAILPLFSKLASAAAKALPAIQAFVGALAAAVGEKLGPILDAVAGALTDIAKLGWGALVDAWEVVGPILKGAANLTWGALTDLVDLAWGGMKDAWEVVGPILQDAASLAWDSLRDLASLAWSEMKDAWATVGPILQNVAGLAWDAMRDAWGTIAPKLQEAAGAAQQLGMAAWDQIAEGFGRIKSAVGDLDLKAKFANIPWDQFVSGLSTVKSALEPVIAILQPFVDRVLVAAKNAVKDLGAPLAELGAALVPLGQAFLGLIKALEPLAPLLEPLGKLLGAVLVGAIILLLVQLEILIKVIAGALTLAIEAVILTIKALTLAIEAVTPVVEAVATAVAAAFGSIQAAAETAFPAVQAAFDTALGAMDVAATTTVGAIKATFATVSEIVGTMTQIMADVVGAITGAVGNVSGAMLEIVVAIMGPINQIISAASGLGASIISAFIAGISGAAGRLYAFVDGIVGTLKSKLDPRNWGIPGLSPLHEAYPHYMRIVLGNMAREVESNAALANLPNTFAARLTPIATMVDMTIARIGELDRILSARRGTFEEFAEFRRLSDQQNGTNWSSLPNPGTGATNIPPRTTPFGGNTPDYRTPLGSQTGRPGGSTFGTGTVNVNVYGDINAATPSQARQSASAFGSALRTRLRSSGLI